MDEYEEQYRFRPLAGFWFLKKQCRSDQGV